MVRLFHDDQSGQQDFIKTFLYSMHPQLHAFQQIYKLGRNLSKDGR